MLKCELINRIVFGWLPIINWQPRRASHFLCFLNRVGSISHPFQIKKYNIFSGANCSFEIIGTAYTGTRYTFNSFMAVICVLGALILEHVSEIINGGHL